MHLYWCYFWGLLSKVLTNVVSDLIKLHAEGDNIRNYYEIWYSSDGNVTLWLIQHPQQPRPIADWINDVKGALEKLGEPAKAQLFVSSVPFPSKDHHNADVNLMRQRLERLNEYIHQLDKAPL